MYNFSIRSRAVSYDPVTCEFSLTVGGEVWQWCRVPYVRLSDGTQLSFSDAECGHEAVDNGVEKGARAEYVFRYGGESSIRAITHMMIETCSGRVNFRIRVEGDRPREVGEVRYPGPISLNADEGAGYTVYPTGQGVLIPAKAPDPIDGIGAGIMYSRSSIMPFFGQMRNGTGYCAIYGTPHDSKHYIRHVAGGDTTVEPIHIPSLGQMAHTREMIYDFFETCDYVSIAKHYRNYVKEEGQLVALDEEAVINPNVTKLYGAVVIRKTAKRHIVEGTKDYNAEDPSKNDSCVTFDEIGEQLKKLHRNGIHSAIFHLGGWCEHGYDNRHPDPFPIAPDAGGEEGLRRLAETCQSLGYMFAVHDQYRDYYYDAETFTLDNAVLKPDGSHPYCDIWHGGAHTFLCAKLAPAFVRRNFKTFEEIGVPLDGVYLDVFSVVELDECVNPDHPMTREECAQKRRECFDFLNAHGMLTASEDVIDCIIGSLPLTDSAQHFVAPSPDPEKQGPFSKPQGIPIPLFNLVYHDCIIARWNSSTKPNVSAYGVPAGESKFLHGVLNGGTMWVNNYDDVENLKEVKKVQELHKRIAPLEMMSHEFIDGNLRRQRTTFADGTAVEVDFDANTYKIKSP